MSFKKSFKVLIVFIGIIVLSSCSKEKAEAVQLAAEQFRVDAVLALEQMNYLFNQDVATKKLTEEEIIEVFNQSFNTLKKSELKARKIDELANSYFPSVDTISSTNEEVEKIKAQYDQFAEMFASLDKGSYFAKDAVKKAEKHAINLTLQLINYARMIQEGDHSFVLKRKEILVRMKAAKDETNIELQKELFNNLSFEFLQLLKEEKLTKDRTIRQCYKAAESGKIVTELIKNYDSMSFGDIMNSIKGGLNYAMEITDGNQNIADMTTKFEGFEKAVKADIYYKPLLNKEFISGN